MFKFLRPKPRTKTEQFVSELLSLSGKSLESVSEAVDVSALLTGGKIPARALAKHAFSLHNGPMRYRHRDLGVSTALFFFRDVKYHDVLAEHQLSARMSLIEWIKSGQLSNLVAGAFEASLYDRYAPSRSDEFQLSALERWPQLVNIVDDALGKIEAGFSFMDFALEAKPMELAAVGFGEAVDSISRMSMPMVVDSVIQGLSAVLVDLSERSDNANDFVGGVEDALMLLISFGFGAAPAISLATEVPIESICFSIANGMAEIPWHEGRRDDYYLGAHGFFSILSKNLTIELEEKMGAAGVELDAMQKLLREKFFKFNIDFMQLHPIVHRAVLFEAKNMGGADLAVSSFQSLWRSAQDISKADHDPSDFLINAHRIKLRLYEGENE